MNLNGDFCFDHLLYWSEETWRLKTSYTMAFLVLCVTYRW